MHGENIVLDLTQDAEITWLSLLAPNANLFVGENGQHQSLAMYLLLGGDLSETEIDLKMLID